MPKEALKSKAESPAKSENPFQGRKYIRAVGRRKTSKANVKLYSQGSGMFLVNRQPLDRYFPFFSLVDLARSPLEQLGKIKEFDVNVNVLGGGKVGQAQAVRLSLARALATIDEKLKVTLRKLGYLTVDARVKERKNPALKRARRAPQWSKR